MNVSRRLHHVKVVRAAPCPATTLRTLGEVEEATTDGGPGGPVAARAAGSSLADLVAARLGRRQVIAGGVAGLCAAVLGGCSTGDAVGSGVDTADGATDGSGPDRTTTSSASTATTGPPTTTGAPTTAGEPAVRLPSFVPVPAGDDDAVVVPDGYVAQVLIPWGTPVRRGGPAWRKDASNTALEQAEQVGSHHDGMHFFPLDDDAADRGLLVLNHEYVDAVQLYDARLGPTVTAGAAGREQVAKAVAAHGVTVVEVRRADDGTWEHVTESRWNRRVTGTTPVTFAGPVADGHPALASELGNPPLGTLYNCSMGWTPWRTYLTCEENWHGCFGTDEPAWTPTAAQQRYALAAPGSGVGWHRAEPRFDLARNGREANRFGWVVEIDPFDPASTPVKRTALGRIRHESATVTERDGHVVVYTGDDEDGEYLYRFVGAEPWRAVLADGRSPLDEGTLSVARFDDDGSGTWVPLVHGAGPLQPGEGWSDQADVLLRTREAADAVGATRLHRPEWIAVDRRPGAGDVYVTLTNGRANGEARVNGDRGAPNTYGHVVRFREVEDDDAAFTWDVVLYAGDPEHPEFGGTRIPEGSRCSDPPTGCWWTTTACCGSPRTCRTPC